MQHWSSALVQYCRCGSHSLNLRAVNFQLGVVLLLQMRFLTFQPHAITCSFHDWIIAGRAIALLFCSLSLCQLAYFILLNSYPILILIVTFGYSPTGYVLGFSIANFHLTVFVTKS